jgi:DNA-binding response OmpR family regulator
LVLLDVSMPKLDGWETCRLMRQVSDVPIMMLIGRDEEADKARGLDLGADDYLTKPFGFVELQAAFGHCFATPLCLPSRSARSLSHAFTLEDWWSISHRTR